MKKELLTIPKHPITPLLLVRVAQYLFFCVFFLSTHMIVLSFFFLWLKRIGDVMVSVLATSAVGRGFEFWSGQTKDYEIGMCYFSAEHAALRRMSKDWLARNQDNMSEWCDMSIRGLVSVTYHYKKSN
jgi:hypothetical protein